MFSTQELSRYVLAGGLAFVCDTLILYTCIEMLGMHYLVSNIFGYFTGMMVVYTLNTRWVFSFRRYQRKSVEFGLFNLILLAGFMVNELLMYLIVGTVGMHYLWAKVIATGVVFVGNFIARKFLLFYPAGNQV